MKYFKLKKQSDFQKLFQKGKRGFSPSLTVIYFPADKLTMGVSVGKRHGKSVKRNKIKRLVREAFRLTQKSMQGKYAIVIIPKVAEEYSFQNFEKHFLQVIKKEKL